MELELKLEPEPIMSAAAVLIHLPSPNGFGGTGDSSKRISVAGGRNTAVVRAPTPTPDEIVIRLRRIGDLRKNKSL